MSVNTSDHTELWDQYSYLSHGSSCTGTESELKQQLEYPSGIATGSKAL